MAEADGGLGLDFEAEFRRADRCMVARSHIIQASRLLIIDGDVLSSMTLICAALDVLEGVSHSQSLKTWLDQGVLDHGRDVEVARHNVRAQYNFLKHANRDPSRQLRKLSPDMIMALIYGAVHDYEQLYGCISIDMLIARMWALARGSALRDEDEHSRLGEQLEALFKKPHEKTFDEGREVAAHLLALCKDAPLEVAQELLGPGPQERLCHYRGPNDLETQD